MSVLKEGDLAPPIKAMDENGKEITLEEYLGKKVVLYFTPGIIHLDVLQRHVT